MANDFQITIQGVDRLIAKLGKVQGSEFLRPPMKRAVDRLWEYMAKYPQRKVNRPGYKRGSGPINKKGKVIKYTSEKMGQKWTRKIEEESGGLLGKVGNTTSYIKWVQIDETQADVHKRYWKNTDRNAIRQNRSAIVKDFNASIKEALK